MRATTVGFSGSGASRRALRWAVQSSAAAGRPLHVVVGPGGAHADLDELLAEELERVPGREPAVDVTLTTDDPVRTLVHAAQEGADLVLGCGRGVGPRGPGEGVLAAVLAASPGTGRPRRTPRGAHPTAPAARRGLPRGRGGGLGPAPRARASRPPAHRLAVALG